MLKVAADIRAVRGRRSRGRRAVRRVAEHRRRRGRRATSRPRSRWRRSSATTHGELLLTQRADSGCGCTRSAGPTSATRRREIAVKEVLEETGIEVRAGVADRGARRSAPRVRAAPALLAGLPLPDDGGELQGHPLETRAVGFFAARRPAVAARRHRPLGRPRVRAPSTARCGPATSTRPGPRPGGAGSDCRPVGQPRRLSSVIVNRGRSSTPMSARPSGPPDSRSITQTACSTTAPRLGARRPR